MPTNKYTAKVASLNPRSHSFVSRDLRTHQLFRASWHLAAERSGINVSVIARGFGFKRILESVFRFWVFRKNRRIIFGTSEICLYSLLSFKSDVWVFTGLGRLLASHDFRSVIVKIVLKLFYRGQLVIVLNEQDKSDLNNFIGVEPKVLEGEGYKFSRCCALSENLRRCGELRFTYVGRLLRSKGVDRLLHQFSKYSQKNWVLTIIGDNDFHNSDSISKEELETLSNRSTGSIVFTGFRSDVKKLLETQDVYISLSEREGLPFSVLDAIDAGLYLILSQVPGHLSFAGLPGVHIVAGGLENVFSEMLKDADRFLKFNREIRLEICNQRFGQEAIVKQICEVVF